MAPSRTRDPHSRSRLSVRAPGAGWWPLAALLLLAVALGLGAVLGKVLGRARADAQPTLSVSVKSGTGTQTTYTVAASGFPANVPYTETYGGGSGIPPATGTTSAAGSFSLWWTLDAGSKYCGTISASAGSAQASASFWVAVVSDPASGTSCAGQGASGTPTAAPTAAATATASAQATATPAATPAAAPTAVPTSGGSTGLPGVDLTGLTRLLKRVPRLWVGGGAAALVLLLIIIIAARAAGKQARSKKARQPARGMPAPGQRQGRAQNAGWGADPGWRQQSSWRAPVVEQPPMYRPEERAGGSHRQPGAGPADSRWRIMDPEDPRGRAPAPDPRWSRSQPGRQLGDSGHLPARTLGRFPAPRERAPRRERP